MPASVSARRTPSSPTTNASTAPRAARFAAVTIADVSPPRPRPRSRQAESRRGDRLRRPRSVVRDEGDMLPRSPQSCERLGSTGDHVIAAVQHAVQIEEEGGVRVAELARHTARRTGRVSAGPSLLYKGHASRLPVRSTGLRRRGRRPARARDGASLRRYQRGSPPGVSGDAVQHRPDRPGQRRRRRALRASGGAAAELGRGRCARASGARVLRLRDAFVGDRTDPRGLLCHGARGVGRRHHAPRADHGGPRRGSTARCCAPRTPICQRYSGRSAGHVRPCRTSSIE